MIKLTYKLVQFAPKSVGETEWDHLPQMLVKLTLRIDFAKQIVQRAKIICGL